MKAVESARGMSAAARWVIGIILGTVLLNVLLVALRSAVGGPGGPQSSSYATGPNGVAAYAQLLAENGHPVIPLRGPLSENEIHPSGTLVVLDPEIITRDDASAIRDFVSAGGHLLIGGGDLGWLEPLMEHPAEWQAGGPTDARVLAPLPETTGISELRTAGEGSWAETGGAGPALGTPASTVVAVAKSGTGRAVLLADTSFLQNRLLGHADNAAFGLTVAGPTGTPVFFAEGVHGYGTQSGFTAIPVRWKWTLGGLTLAALVWMVAAGRRLGPPEEDARVLPPPRRAYVDSLATTLARTKRRDDAIAPVKATVRAALAHRAGLRSDASDNELRRVAGGFGLSEEETRALFQPATSEVETLAVGRALAKLTGGER